MVNCLRESEARFGQVLAQFKHGDQDAAGTSTGGKAAPKLVAMVEEEQEESTQPWPSPPKDDSFYKDAKS